MSEQRNNLADLLADSIYRHTGVSTSSSKSIADELLAAGLYIQDGSLDAMRSRDEALTRVEAVAKELDDRASYRSGTPAMKSSIAALIRAAIVGEVA